MSKPLIVLAAMAGALSMGAVASHAGDSKAYASHADRKQMEQQAIRDAVRRGQLVPLPRILATAQAKVPGDVLKVELEQKSWGLKYEVKILTPSGRVREIDLDARTGAILKIEDD